MRSVSRRRFLTMAAGAGGIAALAWAGRYGLVGSSPPAAGDLRRVSSSGTALGSHITITAMHQRADLAHAAIAAAFAELHLIERVMSLYLADSDLCRLNRTGRLDDPHPYLAEVLQQAGSISQQSSGAFDVTVQPLWDLYAAARHSGASPTKANLHAACSHVDYRRVHVAPESIRLDGKGTAVTLNGIAQGFAADRVLARLAEHSIRHALVNTGEIGSLGSNAAHKPWCAGIQHPRRADEYLVLVPLDGRCMATSGDYATPFTKDLRSHHIFDPGTGCSPMELASATVVAPTATQADGFSTAAMVMGRARAMEMVRSMPGVDGLLVCKDGSTMATDNFPAVL